MSLMIALLIVVGVIYFSYIINDRDIATPSMTIFFVFLISLLFNIINYEKWEVSFSVDFFLVITIGFIATIIGELVGKIAGRTVNIQKKNSSPKIISLDEHYLIRVPMCINVIVIMFMVAVAILYYKDMIRIATVYGNLSLQSVLQAVRNVTYSAGSSSDIEAGTSTFLSHAILISKAVGYVYIYAFLFNIVYSSGKRKLKNNWIYPVPPVIYIIESVFSTSRSQILYFFAGACFMFYLLWICRYGRVSQRTKLRFIKYGILVIIVFCAIFYLLGFLTKKSETLSFFDNISVYIGGSLVSLNNWLENFLSTTTFFGEESLVGIRKVLYKLHLTDHYVVRHLEFVSFGAYRGNVYSASRRYLSDFGYAGLFIMQVLSTFSFSFIYNKIKRKMTPSGLIIVYGYIIYAAAMEAIDELFFSAVFEISNVYILIYGFFIYKYIVKRNTVNEKNIFKSKCNA